MSARSFFAARIIEPVKSLLQQGMTPKALARSLAAGAVLAVFPVFGVTSLLCLLAAAGFRLNHVAIQAANYGAYPLQFLLFIPFIRLGEQLFGLPPVAADPVRIMSLAQQDFSQFISLYGKAVAAGCVAWAILALPALLLVSRVLQTVLVRLSMKK